MSNKNAIDFFFSTFGMGGIPFLRYYNSFRSRILNLTFIVFEYVVKFISFPRPPSSPFEPWSPKPQGFSMRGQRRYSSPSGNGMRSPTTDFWPSQQSMGGFQRSWQSASEQAPYPDPTQVSMSSGLRPTADPWPPAATAVSSNSNSQATLATSGQGDTMTFMAGGIGMR